MNKARAEAIDRGEGLYGGRGVDPYVKGAEDIGKIQKARDTFLTIDPKTNKPVYDLPPELDAYFDAAEKSVLDRMKPAPARGRDFVGPPAPVKKPRKETETSKSAAEYFAPEGELDVFEALGRKRTFPGGKGGTFRGRGATGGWDIQDYFQAPTDTVPESNIPRRLLPGPHRYSSRIKHSENLPSNGNNEHR